MDEEIKQAIKQADKAVKRDIVVDKNLNNLLQTLFPNKNKREAFIKKCLRRRKTRRMLLQAQWYTEIADDLEKIRQNRPALRLIFLIALAESITKTRLGKKNIGSLDAVKDFFEYIFPTDKRKITNSFRRALLGAKTSKLRFSSIIRILCEVRNEAVHGEDFWSFPSLTKKRKKSIRLMILTVYLRLVY